MRELYAIYEKSRVISTDSRDVKEGAMFFALRGEHYDGNKFAAEALEKGAVLAVVDDPKVAVSDKYRVVNDALASLQHLAIYHRRYLRTPILAITGSNGKTTTKELVARVLSSRFRVLSNQGNLNNHIGVPLTILNMNERTEFGIVEMGASGLGEIERLCAIAQPDFGVITNIGKAHLEGFGSFEGVVKGKGELYDYLEANKGLVFYLLEDANLVGMVKERGKLLAKSYSISKASGIRHNLSGEYNKFNIAAAVAIGEYFGVTNEEIVKAISSYRPDNMRSQRVETGRNVLIVDCYNANPSSMEASIANFVSEKTALPKTIILGDMLELGEYSSREHMAIIKMVEKSAIRSVYLVGEHFREAAQGIGDFKSFKDIASFKKFLTEHPIKGANILIKGSNSIGLDSLMSLL